MRSFELKNLDRNERCGWLQQAHGNATLLPSERVEFDFLTDSLQHQAGDWSLRQQRDSGSAHSTSSELDEWVASLFGFPFHIPLSQGRLAEALLARLRARPGSIIPTNVAFPTTRLHQELQGAQSVEVLAPQANDPHSRMPFKGNLDLPALKALIQRHSAQKVSYVCVELCVNGLGGQPCSLENLRALRELTRQHGIPLFLDATRILENAFQIRKLEQGQGGRGVWEIVREICSLADGMTMSLTKDFHTPIGGLLACRDEALYQQGLDFATAIGDGLSLSAKTGIAAALRLARYDTKPIELRMHLVRKLHEGLEARGFPLLQPVGGHAVVLLLEHLLPHLSAVDCRAHALNRAWYEELGIRGAPHMGSAQAAPGSAELFRLAIPQSKYTETDLEEVLQKLESWYAARNLTHGLRQVFAPPVPGGALRAWFAPAPSTQSRAHAEAGLARGNALRSFPEVQAAHQDASA